MSQPTAAAGWRARVIAPAALGPDDKAAWTALLAAHPEYDTPLLTPDFAVVAAQGRRDARIALIENETGLGAVLACLVSPDGLGRPIGAPFCDYSGPVVRKDFPLSLKQIAALAGLAGYRTHSLLDPWNRFEADRTGGTASRLVRMQGLAPAEYLEQRRSEHPKRFKNFRRLESQMGRDGHVLTLSWGPLDDALRSRLFALKSVQYKASGLVDLITAPRARAVLDAVAANPAGFQAALWSGDTLVSADFGFRAGSAFHPWIAAYDPAFAQYSPGNLFQRQVIEHMTDMGLDSYDLAEGHDHYKKYFTNSGRMIYDADLAVPGPRGWYLAAQGSLWRAAGADREGSATGRLKRRMDQAAICLDRTSDRAADLMTALRKRSVSTAFSGSQTSGQD